MGVAVTKQSIDLGIVTTNGDVMLAFYRDLLGLKYLRQMPMPLGKGGVMHQMLSGESVIKLVVLPEVGAKPAGGGIPGASGYRYWTITVSNLAEIVATCVQAGTRVAVRETEVRPGVRIAIVEDPDGNLVEFLQIG